MPNRTIMGLPVKHAGLAIPDPTQTKNSNWTVSCMVTRNLVTDLGGSVEFHSGYHIQLLKDIRK